jgi:hypothetical protein
MVGKHYKLATSIGILGLSHTLSTKKIGNGLCCMNRSRLSGKRPVNHVNNHKRHIYTEGKLLGNEEITHNKTC